MKILKWSEVLSLKGDVVFLPLNSLKSEEELPTIAYSVNNQRLCSEDFPILIPDYEDSHTYFDTMDKFEVTEEGVVSNLETTGDVVDIYEQDRLMVIYDKKDIGIWIDTLNSLDIQY